MHLFTVWAPNARTMAVQIDGTDHPMQRAENGWWSAEVENAGPGTEYKLRWTAMRCPTEVCIPAAWPPWLIVRCRSVCFLLVRLPLAGTPAVERRHL